MSDDRRVTLEGIHIDRDVAEAVAIEEELDSSVVGPYRFPTPLRRRTAAGVHVIAAVVVGFVVDPRPALALLALAAWHWASAWPLEVEQEEAVERAGAAVDFGIGHASAAVTFHGVRARPRWSVILYSAAEPPDRRALVVVDAVDGEVIGDPFVEAIG